MTDIRAGHDFDHKKLINYLKETNTLSKTEDAFTIKQFANGQSNPTFIVSDAKGPKLVVRKQPNGKLLVGAHAIDREYKVMTALQDIVPVPATRGYCNDISILGTPFYYYEYVPGRFFKDPAMLNVSCRNERTKIYENMIDTLAKIHSLDVDKCGLGGFGKRVTSSSPQPPYVLRQIKTWSRMYQDTATEVIEDMDILMKELPDLLPRYAEQKSVQDLCICNIYCSH